MTVLCVPYVEDQQLANTDKSKARQLLDRCVFCKVTPVVLHGVIAPDEQLLNRCVFQLLLRNVKRFRGGLAFKAHRLVYHSG